MTLEDVRAFYKQYYVARNATVAIVGNVERWQAEEIVKALVSDLPAGDKAAALPEVQPLTEAKKVDHRLSFCANPYLCRAAWNETRLMRITSACM